MNRKSWLAIVAIVTLLSISPFIHASPRKVHVVVLGAARKVPYSRTGDPAGAAQGETELKIRALLVDGILKEWTTGEAHDVTDRSFVVRRVLKINDTLPGYNPGPTGNPAPAGKAASSDKPALPTAKPALVNKPKSEGAQEHWVWQRGPWLLVDRVTGHIIALKLPDYDPGVSQVAWFRDYGAYCGLTVSGKSLYGVVAQVEARKAVLAKKLSAFDPESHAQPACGPAEWQREPLRVTFHPTGKEAASFDVIPGSAVLVEDAGDEEKQDTGKKD